MLNKKRLEKQPVFKENFETFRKPDKQLIKMT